MSDEGKLISHYQLKTLLRKDGFGAVYLSEDTRDQKAVVLRVIELDHQALVRITGRVRSRSQRDHPLIERIRQRMKSISELKHSHILPVLEFGEEHMEGNHDIVFYMVSPFEKESLLSYWSEHYSSVELISLEVVADLLVQATEALRYVHKHGLVHQYVRLSSFMLRSSTDNRKHPHLLLTDFWFADITTGILEEGQISQALSTYLATEQLEGRAVPASDQYALAVLVYELLLGYRLSRVDLSVGLYERLIRQRSSEASMEELELAHRIDLVLARALAEDASARFSNIDDFAYAFRSVSRGEVIDLEDEATFKLPAASQSQPATEGAATGEIIEEVTETTRGDSAAEMLAAAEVEEEMSSGRGRGLHKTVLTSEGMTGAEEEAVTEFSETTAIEEEKTHPSAAAPLEESREIALEQTASMGSAAALAANTESLGAGEVEAGEVTQIADTGVAGPGIVGPIGGTVLGEVLGSGMEATQVGGSGVAGTGTGGSGVSGAETGGSGVVGAGVTGAGTEGLGASGAGYGGSGVAGSGGLTGGGGYTGVASRGRRRRRRLWLIAALLALLLLFLGAGIFVFAQNLNQSTSTVTLTLESHTIQNTYVVTASTEATTTTQGQIGAREINQVVSQSKTGQASGYFAGEQATGFITFKSTAIGCRCPVIIPAGTTFTDAHGVTVVTDASASVAAMCTVTVRAHAANYGPGGDIPANDIHAAYSPTISATNPNAFSGGQSGQDNSVVQQSDIDHLTTTLQTQTIQSAQAGLQSQVKSNEHLFASPICQSKTTSDHADGDVASSVTVTVTTTCTAEVYDYTAAVQMVQQQIQTQASTYFSDDFVLQGTVQTQVESATVVDAKVGKILLVIKALGKWAYRLNNTLKQALLHVIAGRSVSDARSILASQKGVSNVQIAVSGGDQSKLPSDPSRITVVYRSE